MTKCDGKILPRNSNKLPRKQQQQILGATYNTIFI